LNNPIGSRQVFGGEAVVMMVVGGSKEEEDGQRYPPEGPVFKTPVDLLGYEICLKTEQVRPTKEFSIVCVCLCVPFVFSVYSLFLSFEGHN